MLVEAHPYKEIAQTYSNVSYTVGRRKLTLPAIDWQSIRKHYRNGHMPTDAKAVRDIVEARLTELGKHVEDLEERLVDSHMTAKLVMAKGFEALARGEIEPTVKETLAAAKLLEQFEIARRAQEGQADVVAWQEAMMIYFRTAQEVMPPDMWSRFTAHLMTNPELRALAARLEGDRSESSTSDSYLDGEIVNMEDP